MMTTTLRLGTVFTDWTGNDRHDLCLDLTEFRLFVDSLNEFVPLKMYLRDYPERRATVIRVLCERMG